MSESEQVDRPADENEDVEAHRWKHHGNNAAEEPETESEENDVEAHRWKHRGND